MAFLEKVSTDEYRKNGQNTKLKIQREKTGFICTHVYSPKSETLWIGSRSQTKG
jgi:hypothetical protein